MENMPIEIQAEIVSYLLEYERKDSVINYMLVNKTFYQLVKEDSVYKFHIWIKELVKNLKKTVIQCFNDMYFHL